MNKAIGKITRGKWEFQPLPNKSGVRLIFELDETVSEIVINGENYIEVDGGKLSSKESV